MNFLLSPPTPFFISDLEYKKKIERIQEDFLWRMKKEDELKIYAYLQFLIRIKEGKI